MTPISAAMSRFLRFLRCNMSRFLGFMCRQGFKLRSQFCCEELFVCGVYVAVVTILQEENE